MNMTSNHRSSRRRGAASRVRPALLLTLLLLPLSMLAACGDGGDSSPAAAGGTTQKQAATGTSGPNDATESRDTTTVERDAYSFELPAGWKEGPATPGGGGERSAAPGPETLVTGEAKDGLEPNVNVMRQPTAGRSPQEILTGVTDVMDDPSIKRRLHLTDVEIEAVEEMSLGGESALSQDVVATTEDDFEMHQRFILAVRDGTAYSVTLTSGGSGAGEAEQALETMLDTWSWR